MEEVKAISDIFQKSGFVDCYVSTDEAEVGALLEKIGFTFLYLDDSLVDQYADADIFVDGASYQHSRNNLRVDAVDMPLSECLELRSEIDFMPMAKVRIYADGNTTAQKTTIEVLKLFESERQNMAFVNENITKKYVLLSEFYVPPHIPMREENLALAEQFSR